jgi:hypothetical protein
MEKLRTLFERCLRPRAVSRYDHLLALSEAQKPQSLLEVGVWRGDRGERFLRRLPSLVDYVGLDLFEGMDTSTYVRESMGNCSPTTLEQVQSRLESARRNRKARIHLIPGRTELTMPRLLQERPASFDFIFIDGGHSLETVENDWHHAAGLVRPGGLVVFDDYYPNDSSRGAKRLVDRVVGDPRYRVRFFPMIEDIVEDLQITMVSIQLLRQ